jgi:hypothetical protein
LVKLLCLDDFNQVQELVDPSDRKGARKVSDPTVSKQRRRDHSLLDGVGSHSCKDIRRELGDALTGDPSVGPKEDLGAISQANYESHSCSCHKS